MKNPIQNQRFLNQVPTLPAFGAQRPLLPGLPIDDAVLSGRQRAEEKEAWRVQSRKPTEGSFLPASCEACIATAGAVELECGTAFTTLASLSESLKLAEQLDLCKPSKPWEKSTNRTKLLTYVLV